MKTNSIIRLLKSCSLLALVLLIGAPISVRANISVKLDFYQDNNADIETQFYYCYAYLEGTQPLTSHHVISPDGQIRVSLSSSNTLYDFNGGNYGSLDSMIEAVTNGVWTLILNTNDASEETYTFEVSIVGLDSDSYPLAVIIIARPSCHWRFAQPKL